MFATWFWLLAESLQSVVVTAFATWPVDTGEVIVAAAVTVEGRAFEAARLAVDC